MGNEFTPIETQEQLDSLIGERIKRERETQEKKYQGYISPEDLKTKTEDFEKQIGELNKALKEANDKIAGHDKELADRDTKIKSYESHSVKSRIAHEAGLSYAAVDFLQGDDEESIRKSAEALKSLVGKQAAAPLASTESSGAASDQDALLKQTLRKMKGE